MISWITIINIVAFCSSIIGCLLCNRKNILCWPIWIVADGIFVYIYYSNGLTIGALREFVFIFLCFEGYYRWKYKGGQK